MKTVKVSTKNSAMLALEKMQEAFEGKAKRLNLKTEADVVEFVKNARKQK